MSLLLLKKKIQEEFARLDKAKWKKYSEEGFSPDDIFEIVLQDQANWFLEQIDELEKEETMEEHDAHCGVCQSFGYGPTKWSGRSEAEIRERIAFWEERLKDINSKKEKDNIDNANRRVYVEVASELRWVLSSSEKKDHVHEWKQGLVQPFRLQGTFAYYCESEGCDEHIKFETVSSAPKEADYSGFIEQEKKKLEAINAGMGVLGLSKPKEKCEHEASNVSCLVNHSHGKQCVKCKKCGEWSSEWEKISREEPSRGLPFYDEGNGIEWGKPVDRSKEAPKAGVQTASEEKPKPALLLAKENFEYWDTFGLLSELASWEHIQENITPEQNASYIQGRIDSYRSAVEIARKVPVFTLSEMAELMEKIAYDIAYKHTTSVYQGVFPEDISDCSSPRLILRKMDWPRLFREKPDLVERIRKGGN